MHATLVLVAKEKKDKNSLFTNLTALDAFELSGNAFDYVKNIDEEDQKDETNDFLEDVHKLFDFEVNYEEGSFTVDLNAFVSKIQKEANGDAFFVYKNIQDYKYCYPIEDGYSFNISIYEWLLNQINFLNGTWQSCLRKETFYVVKLFDTHF